MATFEDQAHLVQGIAIDGIGANVVELLKVDALVGQKYTAGVGFKRCNTIACSSGNNTSQQLNLNANVCVCVCVCVCVTINDQQLYLLFL
jgi:hypothetical protein